MIKRVAVVLIIFTQVAFNSIEAYGMDFIDAPSCSEWNGSNRAYRIWIAGYMDGIAAGKNKDFLEGVSLDEIVQSINRFCDANPKGEVVDGGMMLAERLIRQRRR